MFKIEKWLIDLVHQNDGIPCNHYKSSNRKRFNDLGSAHNLLGEKGQVIKEWYV